jgi:hypothetical protein
MDGIMQKDDALVNEGLTRSISLMKWRNTLDKSLKIDYETIQLAKVATFFGRKVEINSPYVPSVYIPFIPLEQYETLEFIRSKEEWNNFTQELESKRSSPSFKIKKLLKNLF